MKKIKKTIFLIFNIAILIFLISLSNIVSVVFDIGYHSYNSQTDNRYELPNYAGKEKAKHIFDDFHNLKVIYKSFLGWVRLPFRGETTTIGDDGLRIHIPNPSNSVYAKKVAFFCGSTMRGSGVDDSHTIPALFDKLTNRHSSRFLTKGIYHT